MLRVKEAIVVEGRYDKNALSQVVDAYIVETSGFGIFRDVEKRRYLRLLAEKRGLIIMTDSDGAGFVIRNHLRGAVDPRYVKHAYIPDVYGKEKRKRSPSCEGKLGVEGMRAEVLLESLRRAGATFEEGPALMPEGGITKADMYALGIAGGAGSSEKRRVLQRRLGLPERMTANALLQALNVLTDLDGLREMLLSGSGPEETLRP